MCKLSEHLNYFTNWLILNKIDTLWYEKAINSVTMTNCNLSTNQLHCLLLKMETVINLVSIVNYLKSLNTLLVQAVRKYFPLIK